MEIFYKMSRIVDFDELWSKQVSVVFFNENEGFDLIRQHAKMLFLQQNACVSKSNFDRISFAVQAPPVCKLSHTVDLLGLKMWFIWQKACVYKGNFDRISFAVQAPPVCKLSHTVVLFGLKLWFLLKKTCDFWR